MLFKFVTVLLLTVLPTAVPVGTSSTRLQSAGGPPDKTERGTTHFLRKENKEKNNKVTEEKDDEGHEMADVDVGETVGIGGAVSNITLSRRTSDLVDSNDWNHGSSAVSAAKSGTLNISYPSAQVGDTVFLFLSRTDGYLPIEIRNVGNDVNFSKARVVSNTKWKRGAECFKSRNRAPKCMRKTDCIEREGDYCRTFSRGDESGTGKDLATVMFYRRVTANDPRVLKLHIRGGTTTWAVVTAIPNVNQDEPIRSVSETSCDFASKSVFPSVYGKENDVLLLSQSFDDAAEKSQFRRPIGTVRLGFTHSKDEAGFLFGERLEKNWKDRETDHQRRWWSQLQGCITFSGCQ